MKEKKARVEDALHATRAAVEEGIVPGGGVALLRAATALDDLKLGRRRADRRQHHPPRLRRAGSPDRWQRRLRRRDRHREDPRATTTPTSASTPQPASIEDLVKAGVIDPTKVTRSALQNASSISALMLTTEAMICEIPEKKSRSGRRSRRPRPGDGLLRSSFRVTSSRRSSPDRRLFFLRLRILHVLRLHSLVQLRKHHVTRPGIKTVQPGVAIPIEAPGSL